MVRKQLDFFHTKDGFVGRRVVCESWEIIGEASIIDSDELFSGFEGVFNHRIAQVYA